MLNLIQSIFRSTAVKILIRFVASLASAIVVISGFLYVLNHGQKTKEEDLEEDDVVIPFEEEEEEEEPN